MTSDRIHIYLGDSASRVRQEARKRGVSVSKFGQVAISAFLDTDENKRDAVMQRRLDRITRQVGKLDRDFLILSESLALFIQYQLAITPPVPVSEQDAARAQARERFAKFIERVARRVVEGKSLVTDIITEIEPEADDFFNIDLEAASNDPQ